MADDDTTTGGTGDDTTASGTGADTVAAGTKDDTLGLGDAGKRAIAAERTRANAAEKAAKDAQAELDKLRSASMSEQEKAVAAAREEGAKEANVKYLRVKVGTAKGLPLDLAERLQGESEEEMSADAELLLKALPSSTGSGDGGPRGKAPENKVDMNDLLHAAVGKGS